MLNICTWWIKMEHLWNVGKSYALCILICDQLDIKLTWADIYVCLRPVPVSLTADSGLRVHALSFALFLSTVWCRITHFECGFLATRGYVNHAHFVISSNYKLNAVLEGSPFWVQNLLLVHQLFNKNSRITVRLCILLWWTTWIYSHGLTS